MAAPETRTPTEQIENGATSLAIGGSLVAGGAYLMEKFVFDPAETPNKIIIASGTVLFGIIGVAGIRKGIIDLAIGHARFIKG